MRYSSTRKYPITEMKKGMQSKSQERILDLTVGSAAGLLALVFAEGLILGCMYGKRTSR